LASVYANCGLGLRAAVLPAFPVFCCSNEQEDAIIEERELLLLIDYDDDSSSDIHLSIILTIPSSLRVVSSLFSLPFLSLFSPFFEEEITNHHAPYSIIIIFALATHIYHSSY
jgi:hypothetical protein